MSSNLPATIQAQTPARLQLNDHEIELIKSTVLAGQSVTNDEFSVFLRAAEHLGLDPLMKQVYGIKRQGRLTIQVGIDGYRLVAARTGELVGSDRPAYGPPMTIANGNSDLTVPEWAEVTVTRLVRGERAEFVGVAYWEEFYPGPGGAGAMWRQMPRKMLGKCAEAEALRKAFPADLAGTYTPDEMAQAGQDDPLRGYRDDLIARARQLPEQRAAQLRAWRHAQEIDPRTSDLDDLHRFEGELANHEAAAQAEADETVVDAELVDDGDLPGDVVPPAGQDEETGGPAAPPVSQPADLAKKAQYLADQARRRAMSDPPSEGDPARPAQLDLEGAAR